MNLTRGDFKYNFIMRLLNKIWTRDKRRKAVAIAMTIILCLAFVNHRVDAYYLLGYKIYQWDFKSYLVIL